MTSGNNVFSYPVRTKTWLTIRGLFPVILGSVLVLNRLENISKTMSSWIETGILPDIDTTRLIGYSAFFVMGGIFLALVNDPIELNDEGIRVKIFIFFWVLIPWNEVLAVKTTGIPFYGIDRCFFICVKRLSIFHRLISLSYYLGLMPAIIVYNFNNNYDELLSFVQSKID